MSIAVTIDDEGRHFFWDDHDPTGLAIYLEEADVVVTFNGKGFDIPMIASLAGRELELADHYDICEEVRKVIGTSKGYKLTEICERTLGHGKITSGALAPFLAMEGRWAQLVSYCVHDVELTRELYQYILQHGTIKGVSNEEIPIQAPSHYPQSGVCPAS
jgi:DEAD/DEAH box helicase domain-containing protein